MRCARKPLYPWEVRRPWGGTDPGARSGGLNLGDIFAGGAGYKPLTASPTSSLNLLGKIERWGIGTGTQLRDLTLKVEQLTGAQLQELIKKLPDGMTYGLDLEREDG